MKTSARLLTAALLAAAASAWPVRAEVRFDTRSDLPLSLLGPTAVVAADFYDNDGDLDVAVSMSLSNAVIFLRNDGGGNLAQAWVLTDPDVPGSPTAISAVSQDPGGLAVADVNGDGLPDLAGANRTGTPRYFCYLNNTDDSVMPGGPDWIPSASSAQNGDGFDLTVTRWSNPPDAFDDLVISSASGSVKIAQGTGDGEFAPVLLFTSSPPGVLRDVEVADFLTTQPMLDVLTVSADSELIIWPGDSALPGSLLTGQLVRIPTPAGGRPTSTPLEAIVDDWNVDGLPDALVVTEQGYLLYFENDGTAGVFGPPVESDLVAPLSADAAVRMPTYLTSVAHADLDGDTLRDLIVADAGDRRNVESFNWLSVYFGCSDRPQPPSFDADGTRCGRRPRHHAAADLGRDRPFGVVAGQIDGQPGPDVLLANGDANSLTLFANDGGGGFVAAARSYSAGGRGVRGADVADVDGDGTSDVVVALFRDSAVDVLLGDGTGGLQPAERLLDAGGTSPSAVILASWDPSLDFTQDALVTFSGSQSLWPGRGDGTFDPPYVVPADGRVRAGEAGGGSALDAIVVREAFGSATVSLWVNDGAGNFSLGPEFSGFFGYRDHVAGRVLGSTRDDVVLIAHRDSGAASPEGLWLIAHDAGSDSYLAPRFIPYGDLDPILDGLTMILLAAADLDRDGQAEVVAASAASLAIVLEGDPTAGLVLAPGTMPPYDTGGTPQGLLLEDVTGDAEPELIVATRNRVTVREGTGGPGFAPNPPVVLLSNIDNDRVRAGDLNGDGLPELLVTSSATSDVTVFVNASTAGLRLRVGRPAATRDTVSWNEQGAGATYDLLRGDLVDLLRNQRDITAAACLADDLATPEHEDPAPPPARQPGDTWAAWYYVVRCAGGECAELTYGADSFGLTRVPGAGDCAP